MATTQITTTAFKTAVAECADAIALQDWQTAWIKYGVAQAIHLGLLNQKVGDSGSSVERFQSLGGLKDALTAIQQATGGTATGPSQTSFTRGIPRS